MQTTRAPQQQPSPIPTPAHDRCEPQEDEHIGKALGLDAADDPFAGHVRIFIEQYEQRGGKHRQPGPRQYRPTQASPGPSQQPPRQQPAEPSHRPERQQPGEPTERPKKHLMRIGRVHEKIMLAPIRIPIVFGFRKIIRLVDVGNGPRSMQEEDRKDQCRFDDRPPPRRGRRVISRQWRIDRQTSHPAAKRSGNRALRSATPRGGIRLNEYISAASTASRFRPLREFAAGARQRRRWGFTEVRRSEASRRYGRFLDRRLDQPNHGIIANSATRRAGVLEGSTQNNLGRAGKKRGTALPARG